MMLNKHQINKVFDDLISQEYAFFSFAAEQIH